MDCLVTKLKGTVSGDSLLKLGEMRIKFSKISSFDPKSNSCVLGFNTDTEITIIGDGYFTDKTGSQNNGKTMQLTAYTNTNIFVSNGDLELSIPNKYNLTRFSLTGERRLSSGSGTNENKSADISELRYSKDIIYISLDTSNAYGDISVFENLSKLSSLYAVNLPTEGNLYGDISGILENCKNLESLSVTRPAASSIGNIYGDIGLLKNLASIKIVSLQNIKLSGDLSEIGASNTLTRLVLSRCNVTGSISHITDSSFPALEELGISYTGVSGGELATLPKKIPFFTANGLDSAIFSWKGSRPTDAYIIALEGVNLGSDVDAMLNNQASCQTGYVGHDEQWYKVISVNGTRTSASDTAISTLQEKGYTVTVPMATDANFISLMSVNSLDSGNYGIAYKDKDLIVKPVDLTKMQIYPTSGVTVKKFDTKENAEKFIKDNGLVKVESN